MTPWCYEEVAMNYEKALFKNRQILFPKFINAETAEKVIESLLHLNAINPDRDIKLLFDSIGGEITEGLAVHDILKTIHAPVTGIVYGDAYSMAAIVLQGCRYRKATPHSRILVHSARVPVPIPLRLIKEGAGGEENWPEGYYELTVQEGIVDQRISVFLDEVEDMINIVSERTGKEVEDVVNLFNEDSIMCAEDALDWGLIDEVTDEPTV